MGARENRVETYLKDEVKRLGGDARKWVSLTHTGVPDRIVILRGRVVFVEIKTADGTLAGPQEREHSRLRALGADVCTVYGHAGVDQLTDWLIQNDRFTPPRTTPRLPKTLRGACADT